MSNTITTDKEFKGVDFTKVSFQVGNYEGCTFKSCNFSSIDLFSTKLEDCDFIDCDLSMLQLSNTSLHDVRFDQCKMVGMHFENCNSFLLSMQFTACQLNLASFYKRSLKNTLFSNCDLSEVDFAEADLSKAVFKNCNLQATLFDRSILEGTNFVSAYNYQINPETNRIKKAVFSKDGLEGLLGNYGIIVR